MGALKLLKALLYSTLHPVWLGPDAVRVWSGILRKRTLYTPNGSLGHLIPDHF